MATDADMVFEDLMSYNVFNLDSIENNTSTQLREAIIKDPNNNVSNRLLEQIAKTNKARAIALANTFDKDVKGIKDIGEAKDMLLKASNIENELNVGEEAEFFSAEKFDKAKTDLEAKQIGSIKALHEGRRTALAFKENERRTEFLENITSDDIRLQGRRTVGPLEEIYSVSKIEAINRLRELGFNVNDDGKIL